MTASTSECFIAGIRAGILQLFDGASEIPNVISKGFARTFVKSGNQNKAIKDFYATQPTYIQTYYFPFGVRLFRYSVQAQNTIHVTTEKLKESDNWRPFIGLRTTRYLSVYVWYRGGYPIRNRIVILKLKKILYSKAFV